MSSTNLSANPTGALNAGWVNGWAEITMGADPRRALVAPAGKSTISNALTGQVTSNANVSYFGLPVIGFAVQSYSTTGLPGVSASVLSNYGGQFNHKIARRIVVGP